VVGERPASGARLAEAAETLGLGQQFGSAVDIARQMLPSWDRPYGVAMACGPETIDFLDEFRLG